MLQFFLKAYGAITLIFLLLAWWFRPEALVPVLGFYLLIYPTFLLCCGVAWLLLRALPFASLASLPVKLGFLSFRK